ncbi:MAG: PQQ-dependent sugar dehydrogenase, partial [Pseudolabrys sp.]|nr:PQQ-dependent sugar dehydrogenase [Pseudolabrys sp.]
MARMKNSVLLSSVVVLMISPAAAQTFASSAGDIRVETVATGLVHPWSLQFLPDGRMLVTERPGRMRTVTADGKLSPPLDGVPQVVARGQSGLLDVALDRDFVRNNTIYFCFTYESG